MSLPLDPDRVTERLLWLEAAGITLAARARRLRRQVARTWIAGGDVADEMARLQLELQSREDELSSWEHVHRTTTRLRPWRWWGWWPW